MTKIDDTSFADGFDTHNLKLLRVLINNAIAPIAEKHGITLQAGNISYTNSTVTVKVEGAAAGTDKHAEYWKRGFVGDLLGIDPDALGQTFTQGFRVFKIRGLKSSRSTKVIARDLGNDKDYLFKPEAIAARFPVKRQGVDPEAAAALKRKEPA